MPRERNNVLAALAQGRKDDREDRESIVEVGAKSSGFYLDLEIAIGGGDDPHVDLARAIVTHPLELALLQHPQELRLQLERHLSDLVEEQRPAVGELESSDAIAMSAGERAAHVAEELALEELAGNRGAVHPHERAIGATAPLVDRTREHLFPHAGLAANQDRRAGACDDAGGPEDVSHGGALGDERLAPHLVTEVVALMFGAGLAGVELGKGVGPLRLGALSRERVDDDVGDEACVRALRVADRVALRGEEEGPVHLARDEERSRDSRSYPGRVPMASSERRQLLARDDHRRVPTKAVPHHFRARQQQVDLLDSHQPLARSGVRDPNVPSGQRFHDRAANQVERRRDGDERLRDRVVDCVGGRAHEARGDRGDHPLERDPVLCGLGRLPISATPMERAGNQLGDEPHPMPERVSRPALDGGEKGDGGVRLIAQRKGAEASNAGSVEQGSLRRSFGERIFGIDADRLAPREGRGRSREIEQWRQPCRLLRIGAPHMGVEPAAVLRAQHRAIEALRGRDLFEHGAHNPREVALRAAQKELGQLGQQLLEAETVDRGAEVRGRRIDENVASPANAAVLEDGLARAPEHDLLTHEVNGSAAPRPHHLLDVAHELVGAGGQDLTKMATDVVSPGPDLDQSVEPRDAESLVELDHHHHVLVGGVLDRREAADALTLVDIDAPRVAVVHVLAFPRPGTSVAS